MSKPLRIALIGAGGRMGQAIDALCSRRDDVAVSGRWQRGSGSLDGALQGADVAVDFTHAGAFAGVADAVAAAALPLVSGTTGLDATALSRLETLAREVPVLHDGNMSLGIHLLATLAARAAAALPGYDVEISETHHRAKRDAPSGTALKLGAAVAAARGLEPAPRPRIGVDRTRDDDEIGYAVRRGGAVVGEHTVALFGPFDRLELHHAAADRRLFADGAIAAAAWVVDRAPGRYAMADLFAAT